MKTRISPSWLAVGGSLLAGLFIASAAQPDTAKAEMMGRVEHYFLGNFKDITARKSLAWGEVETAADGSRSIRYESEARIWDKEVLLMNQVFVFDQAGMKALVEDFFQHNFRDVQQLEPLAWGEVTTAAEGNRSIRYRYRAQIWDQPAVTNDQVFTFATGGKFVSVKDAKAK